MLGKQLSAAQLMTNFLSRANDEIKGKLESSGFEAELVDHLSGRDGFRQTAVTSQEVSETLPSPLSPGRDEIPGRKGSFPHKEIFSHPLPARTPEEVCRQQSKTENPTGESPVGALKLTNLARLDRVLARLQVDADTRKACADLVDKDGALGLQDLQNVLGRRSGMAAERKEHGQVDGHSVRELLGSLVLPGHPAASQNLVDKVEILASYDLAGFRQVLKAVLKTLAKQFPSHDPGLKKATPQPGTPSEAGASREGQGTSVAGHHTQAILSKLIPSFAVLKDSPEGKTVGREGWPTASTQYRHTQGTMQLDPDVPFLEGAPAPDQGAGHIKDSAQTLPVEDALEEPAAAVLRQGDEGLGASPGWSERFSSPVRGKPLRESSEDSQGRPFSGSAASIPGEGSSGEIFEHAPGGGELKDHRTIAFAPMKESEAGVEEPARERMGEKVPGIHSVAASQGRGNGMEGNAGESRGFSTGGDGLNGEGMGHERVKGESLRFAGAVSASLQDGPLHDEGVAARGHEVKEPPQGKEMAQASKPWTGTFLHEEEGIQREVSQPRESSSTSASPARQAAVLTTAGGEVAERELNDFLGKVREGQGHKVHSVEGASAGRGLEERGEPRPEPGAMASGRKDEGAKQETPLRMTSEENARTGGDKVESRGSVVESLSSPTLSNIGGRESQDHPGRQNSNLWRDGSPGAAMETGDLDDHRELSGQNRRNSLKLDLEDRDLGRLRLEVETRHHEVSARLTAETEHARSLILQNASTLRQELQSQGLVLGQLHVDVHGQGHRRGDPARDKVSKVVRGAKGASSVKGSELKRPPALHSGTEARPDGISLFA